MLGLRCAGQASERQRQWEHDAKSQLTAAHAVYAQSLKALNRQILDRDLLNSRLLLRVDSLGHAVRRATRHTDTLRLTLTVDTTARDSLDHAFQLIGAQDVVIQTQDQQIKSLSAVVAADSGVRRLFETRAALDSTRIASLEGTLRSRPRPRTLFGLRLPSVHCGVGIGVTTGWVGTLPKLGPTASCTVGY